jgi:hypothetical protein
MPKLRIQQFRATLAGSADQGALARAYRDLARRPTLVAAMHSASWVDWPPVAATSARA